MFGGGQVKFAQCLSLLFLFFLFSVFVGAFKIRPSFFFFLASLLDQKKLECQ